MPLIASNLVDVYVFRRGPGGAEFLALRRSASSRVGDTWQSVHGKIEPGETATQAARRELLEETGLTPLRFWQLESVNTFFVAREDVVMICPGFCAEVAPSAAVTLCHEHSEHRWLAPDAAAAMMLWPGQRAAVREIMDEILTGRPAEAHLRLPP